MIKIQYWSSNHRSKFCTWIMTWLCEFASSVHLYSRIKSNCICISTLFHGRPSLYCLLLPVTVPGISCAILTFRVAALLQKTNIMGELPGCAVVVWPAYLKGDSFHPFLVILHFYLHGYLISDFLALYNAMTW